VITDIFVAVFDFVDQLEPVLSSTNYHSGSLVSTIQYPTNFLPFSPTTANATVVEIVSSVRIGNPQPSSVVSFPSNWSLHAEQTNTISHGVRNMILNREFQVVPDRVPLIMSDPSLPSRTLAVLNPMPARSFFRSRQSGTWSSPASWEESVDGLSWTIATHSPTRADKSILIRSGHTITVTTSAEADEITVESEGVLSTNIYTLLKIPDGPGTDINVYGTFSSWGNLELTGSAVFQANSVYQHNQDGGVIPQVTWDPASLCRITGINYTMPSGLNQVFGHLNFSSDPNTILTMNIPLHCMGNLTFENTGYSMEVNPTQPGQFLVEGDLIFSQGTIYFGGYNPPDITVKGDLKICGGILRVSHTGTLNVIVERDFLFTQGSVYITDVQNKVLNLMVRYHFTHAGGILQHYQNTLGPHGSVNVIFYGSGYHVYTGGGNVQGPVNYTVHENSSLTMADPGTCLTGSGNFTLNANAGLWITSPDGISLSGSTGNIQVTGSRNYSSGGRYSYIGNCPQITGDGLPLSVNALIIDQTLDGAGVTLSNNVDVNEVFYLGRGILTTGSYTVHTLQNAVLLLGGTGSFVNGRMARSFSATGTKVFHVGKNGYYRPVTFRYHALSGISKVTVEQMETGMTGTFPPNTLLLSQGRYWSITQTGGSNLQYYVTLDGTGYVPDAPVLIFKKSGGVITAHPTAGTPYTNAAAFTSMSDFALGQEFSGPVSSGLSTSVSPDSKTICRGAQNLLLTALVSPAPAGGTVQFFIGGSAAGSPVAVNPADGSASCLWDPAALPAGNHEIRADFSGYFPFDPCSSDPGQNALLQVLAAPDPPAGFSISATDCDGSTHTGSAQAGPGESILWYDAPSGGNLTVAPSRNTPGTSSVWAAAVNDATLCECQLRTEVSVTLAEDVEPPEINCQSMIVSLDENGLAAVLPGQVYQSGTDNCGTVNLISLSPDSFTCNDIGNNPVILTVSDAHANTASCQAVVTVIDDTPPVITCPEPLSLNNDPGRCYAVVQDFGIPQTYDNCGVQTVLNDAPDHGQWAVGSHTLTWTVFDVNGLSAQCSQQVSVTDTEAPVVLCPANIVQSCEPGACGSIVSWPESILEEQAVNIDGSTEDILPANVAQSFIASNGGRLSRIVLKKENVTNGVSGLLHMRMSGNFWDDPVIICNFPVPDAAGEFDIIVPLSVAPDLVQGQPYILGFSAPEAELGITSDTYPDGSLIVAFFTIPLHDLIMEVYVESQHPGGWDNCGIESCVPDIPSGSFFNPGATTVTYTATDIHGHTAACSFTVTVNDGEPPVVTCKNIEADLDENGSATIMPADVYLNASDNCQTINLISVSPDHFGCSDVGENPVTLIVDDGHGNQASCTATVTVLDDRPPDITCPPPVSVNADPQLCYATVTSLGNPQFGDNCEVQGISNDAPVNNHYPVGNTIVTWTVLDVNGNTATCSQVVSVTDNQPPSITCPPPVSVNADPQQCYATITSLGSPQTGDNCGVQNISNDAPANNQYPVGNTIVIWTVLDANGNTATCTQAVTVTDNQPPSITCPPPVSVNADPQQCHATVTSLGNPQAIDNCGTQAPTNNAPSNSLYPVGTTTVIWTVYDVNGNSSTCTQPVSVTDNQPPSISCPAPINVNNDPGLCYAVIQDVGSPQTGDNCGVQTVLNDAPDHGQWAVGSHTLTWTVYDVNGLSAQCSQQVNVTDTEAPVVLCPADIIQPCDPGTCGSIVSWPESILEEQAVNIDGSTEDILPAYLAQSFIASSGGRLSRIVLKKENVTNGVSGLLHMRMSGNFWDDPVILGTFPVPDAAGEFDIIVPLSVAPDLVEGQPYILGFSAPEAELAITSDTYPDGSLIVAFFTIPLHDLIMEVYVETQHPGGWDNCGIEGCLPDIPSGSFFNPGATTVTYTATDIQGHTAACSFTVTVVDITPSSPTCKNKTVYLDANGNASVVPADVYLSGTDNCGTVNLVSVSPNSFTCNNLGNNPVVLTVNDGNGNTASCSATVNVVDQIHPTITCPQGIHVNADPQQCYATVSNLGSPQTDDNCSVANLVNNAPGNNQYPVGTTTVIWTVYDQSGNTTTCTQSVTVTDNQPPSIQCPQAFYAFADNFKCYATILNLGTPQTNDNCGVQGVSNNAPGNGQYAVGNHVVTWTVTDHNGNTATCTQDVIVTDNQPPTIICPPHINTHTDQGHCYATVANPGTPGVYDNCGVLSYHNDAPLNGQYAVGSHTITWYVVDIHGNTTQCSQTITVLDNEPPAITCPQQLTVNADPQQCYATIQGLGTPQTSDNCGVQTIINNAPLNGHYPVGNTVVTWTVFDIHGNSATCTQTVTVTDNQPPWLQCPQAVKHCIASGQNGEIVNGLAPLSGDHCGIQSVTYQITGITNGSGSNDASGTFFHAGQSWVTYTVTDVNGNTAMCSVSVQIYNQPLAGATAVPLQLCTGEDLTLYGSGSGGGGSYQYQWTGPNGFSSTDQNPHIPNALATHNGLYQLVVTDDHQCSSVNEAPVTITVWPLPVVGFSGDPANTCLNCPVITLTGGTPAGGTYSGDGVSNDEFDPLLAGPGPHVLTYTCTDGNGCTSSAMHNILVTQSVPEEVTVGMDGDYPTLTGNGGLFEAVNNGALWSNLKVYIISDLQEPGTHALNPWTEDAGGPYTMTIVPDLPVLRNITGNVNMELIRFNGADRVTVDGRYDFEGRYLLFRNLAGFNGTIAYMNDACGHTFRNCIIEGCNRATNGGLLMVGAGVSTGNDNILITENLFRNANATNPNNLLSSYSTVTQSNSGIQVLNNEFKNFRSSGVFVSGIGSATGWTVDGNSFYYDLAAAATTAQSAISFAPVSTSTNNFIRNNMIGGSAANGGGTAWVNSGAVALRGIYVKSGTYTIENNVITNIRMSSAGAASFTGIDLSVVQGLQSKVKYNTIGSATMPHAVSMAGTGAFTGILVNSSLPVQLLEGNIIGNITYTSAGTGSPVIAGIKANKAQLRKNRILEINVNGLNLTPTMYGVWFNGSTGASNECSNNMISMGGGAVLNPLIYGIYEGSAANTTAKHYYNTVNIYGTASTTKKSYCFYRQNSVNVTIKNNIFSNFRSASPLGQYAIYTVSGTYWTFCDYNDLYSATAPIAGWAGADKATFALWKTATGKDAHSVNVMPVYFSNTDLHLMPSNTGIDGKGNPIATFTTDIDGNIRNVATPDIGCDEFTAVLPRLEDAGPQQADLRVYPNPFTSVTSLELVLPEDGVVDLCVYNLLGERVGEIRQGMMYRGIHTFSFRAEDLPTGMYFCRMVVEGKKTLVKRMQLLK